MLSNRFVEVAAETGLHCMSDGWHGVIDTAGVVVVLRDPLIVVLVWVVRLLLPGDEENLAADLEAKVASQELGMPRVRLIGQEATLSDMQFAIQHPHVLLLLVLHSDPSAVSITRMNLSENIVNKHADDQPTMQVTPGKGVDEGMPLRHQEIVRRTPVSDSEALWGINFFQLQKKLEGLETQQDGMQGVLNTVCSIVADPLTTTSQILMPSMPPGTRFANLASCAAASTSSAAISRRQLAHTNHHGSGRTLQSHRLRLACATGLLVDVLQHQLQRLPPALG